MRIRPTGTRSLPRAWLFLLLLLLPLLAGVAEARFEWRDVVQDVTILPDGTVIINDERTLWTDEDFAEAFICFEHGPNQRIVLLPDSGAIDPGPPAVAFTQPCESGAQGTEMVVRHKQRIQQRRVRFHYRFEGSVEAYSDVVQWYWNLIQLDHPPIIGYRLTVTIPGPMSAPYDAYVHRYRNPEEPTVTLSPDRSRLSVQFDRIPPGDGVEIRYLMDPALFTIRGTEARLEELLEDEARIAALTNSQTGPFENVGECPPTDTPSPTADSSPIAQAQQLLNEGNSNAALALLLERFGAAPQDAELRFALGAVQAIAAVEQLSQDAYRFGLGGGSAGELGLLFGLQIPTNPAPEQVGYNDTRAALQRFLTALAQADRTLAPLSALAGSDAGTALRLRLDVGLMRLDLDGDGVPGEPLSVLLVELRNVAAPGPTGERCQAIPIDFDLGDALWLRGYLHLIAGTLETILAYDAQELWDATAQLFFARPITAYPYLQAPAAPDLNGFDLAILADAVAFIHLLDLPVLEPERMQRALTHFETTVQLSRASWRAILAETDDEREWLPNPRQTGVVPARPGGPPLAVTDAIIDNWFELLDEVEAILQGRKLLPYWRVTDGRGIDLRRVFLEPRAFDLVLWLQGAAAAPYLTEGETTRGDTWQRIVRAFGGRFTPFVFWFN